MNVEVSFVTQQGMTDTVAQNIKCADLAHEATHLCQDVLFPHEFLPFPVWLSDDHIQNVLSVVSHVSHKEDEVFQQLCDKPITKEIVTIWDY